MSEPLQTLLARLVLFIVCLAAAGSIAAGTHYFSIDLPQQNAVTAPQNSVCLVGCTVSCEGARLRCTEGPRTCLAEYNRCENACIRSCACSDCQDACQARFLICTSDPKTCLKQHQACENECVCSA